MDYRSLPKIELHLHLDCSLSYDVVRRLDPAISEAEYRRTFIAPRKCASLTDFLTRAPSGIALMQTREGLRLVTEDLFQQLQRDGVIYAEIRFAPLLHTERGLTPQEIVETVNEAAERSSAATGIEARLILCTLRHYSAAQSMETVRLAERYAGSLVTALDIAGDEAGFPLEPHVPAFRYAAEHGIARTAHAGEALGAESVWQTLEQLRPSRIGHGVRSIEDAGLVEHLREGGIHLEVCPTSNVQTGVCDDYAAHPVDHLYRAGVPLNINTDCRTISDITLGEEYHRLMETFAWGLEEFLTCNLAAIDAAFIPDELKERLRERVQRDDTGGQSRTSRQRPEGAAPNTRL